MDKLLATTSVEEASSFFKTYEFSKTVFGKDIHFSVLKMEKSILLWIGLKEEKHFNDLSIGFQSKFASEPLSTHLFGNNADDISKTISSKLAMKLGKPVYLSYNIPDNQMITDIIKALVSEIDTNPNNF